VNSTEPMKSTAIRGPLNMLNMLNMSTDRNPSSAHITLRNLVISRWVLLTLLLVAALLELIGAIPDSLAAWLPVAEHPLASFATLAAWAGHNGTSVWLLRRGRASEGFSGVQLLVDATALTILLLLAGGSANPFTILYFLPLTLATQVSPRWTWVLAGWSFACFASLFVLAEPAGERPELIEAPTLDEHAHHGHQHQHEPAPAPAQADDGGDQHGHFAGHQRGMWIAFGLTGVLMTVFVHRTALAIARQRAELVRLRQDALQDRHLAAIGTLAAGAAHELGTPLGTIKLLVAELPQMSASERDEALTTVGVQLARCKLIVSRMASPELRVDAIGIDARAWPLRELGSAVAKLEHGVPVTIHVSAEASERTTRQPFEVLAQLLREFIANGAEACRRSDTSEAGVIVEIHTEGDELRIEVRDHGLGMDQDTLAAAFDPFFSTRPEGSGMGLGLYLARAHLRQLGGHIELDSVRGRGTTVRVALPLATALDRPRDDFAGQRQPERDSLA
jgi:two-component system sensor histidine kinase RegB